MAEIDERLDRLYELPLDEFTAERDRLAAELLEAGDREGATRLKRARKPNVAAWAVNQLRRHHRSELQELLSVGEELRGAHREALAGGGAEALREVTARRRRVVDGLLARAEALMAQGGHATSRSTLDKVGETLLAATLDEGAAEELWAGRLTRELAPPRYFGALAGDSAPPVPRRVGKPDRQAKERARRAQERAQKAEDDADEAERGAQRMRREAERAERSAERARENAARAARRAKSLRRKAQEARRATDD